MRLLSARPWARDVAPLLVLALVLAGCTAPPAARDEPPSPAPVPEERPFQLSLVAPERVPSPVLDVSVELSERWLKPLRPMEVAARTPGGSGIAWFIELEEVEPRASVLDGEVFLLKTTTPDRQHPGPRARVALEEVASDGRARSLSIPTAGRYLLDAGGARLVVNVWPEAPETPRQAFLIEDNGRLVFEPPEVDAPPRARILLWNQAGRTVELEERAYAAYVPLGAQGGRVTPIDEGLYTIHALAVDSRARGIASVPFLVDFERPSDRLHVGPYEGEFALAEARVETPRRLAFSAAHPLSTLVVRYAAASLAPAPASVVVALEDGNGVLAEASTLTGSDFALGDVPPGDYAVEVRPEHGARVGWKVEIEGTYRLPLPPRLANAT